MRRRDALSFLAGAPLLAGTLAAPALRAAERTPLLDGWAPAREAPNAIIAFAEGGRVLRSEARGAYAADQPVLLASLSKAITGAAILALVADGKLSPDATLGQVLEPIFRRLGRPKDPAWAAVTVAELARHEGGLHSLGTPDPLPPAAFGRLPRGAGIDAALRLALDTPAGPRGRYTYSNLGYLLLGHVVEAVSGRPHDAFAADRLLRPLGVQGAVDPAWRAAGPFGGWRFTPAGYLRFLEIFRPGGPLPERVLALADAEGFYSYGRFRDAARGAWYHTGSWGPRTAFETVGDRAWFLAFDPAPGMPTERRRALRADLMERLRAAR
ncbi:MAG TPA: serine hydrolase domain-containing protein [Azospirillaceae bacterium]|nr:serine hydrolase domain-containing protein [Azospirillaceae bacterium]